MARKQTPSQTVGPYFAYGMAPHQYGYPMRSIADERVARPEIEGRHIRIEGRVFDGAGAVIPDAVIEIWQADSRGRYAHPADGRGSNVDFRGFGRFGTGTDPENRFVFETVKPGRVDDVQAPHVNVLVFMRGLLTHVYTRLYFPDEADANAADPVLSAVDPERRDTLIARLVDSPAGPTYVFDIHMQGDRETVFFDA